MGRQGGGGDKKAQLFGAILNQKLPTVRWGLANAGVAPATRDDEGKTTFMIACAAGRDKSLGEMIRWYERRLAQLRECLELTDDDTGETCFHMAAQAPNGQKCVAQLLDAWLSVDKQHKDAGIKKKDHRGRTVYDVATPKARAIIDDWLVEPETESAISASRGAAAPSRHRGDSCPSDEVVGGFFFDFGAIRTASRPRCPAQVRTRRS